MKTRQHVLIGVLSLVSLALSVPLQSQALDKQLLVAASRGNVALVKELLGKGANVNADNGHGVTPLWYAADQANVALVKLLLDRKADPNAKDLEYGKSPLRVAAVPWSDIKAPEERKQIVALMLEKGAGTEGDALVDLIRGGYDDAVREIVRRGKAETSYLNQALGAAKRAQQADLVDLLTKAGASEPGPLDTPRAPERLQRLTGAYRSASGQELTLRTSIFEDQLLLERPGVSKTLLLPADLSILRSFDLLTVVRFQANALPPPEVILEVGGRREVFKRTGDVASAAVAARAGRSESAVAAAAPTTPRMRDWPSFRGPAGAGVVENGKAPTSWDVATNVNVRWKQAIPGFAHSSPIAWGNRIFVTTTVPADTANLTFRRGSGEEGGASAYTKDDFMHSWRVFALDRDTGKILWSRVAIEGIPQTARHVKASQANSTPATDGKHLVVFFGSEGLYCYDLDGKLLWKRNLGKMPSGRYLDPSYEWNTAASPIIYKNLIILQLDLADSASIVALDVATGKDVWKTERDEQPSWPTPLIFEGPQRTELITAAPLFTRSYDPATGKELWRLGKHSALSTPTPVAGNGLIFITSGGGTTVQPIYAIKPGGNGDITLEDGADSNEHVVWSKHRGGSYIPTPLFLDGILYLCANNGVITALKAETGERLYQNRLNPGGSFSASPVSADGKLYFASEDGDVFVVRAGPKFEQLAVNPMGEVVMATPAISGDLLLVRTQGHLVAIGESATPTASR
jgi:outer membrane protein assembly factor BamB